MPEDINELDVTDAGLKGIFGERFSDMTALDHEKARKEKVSANTTKPEKVAQKPKDKPIEELWQPPKPAPGFMDKLKDAVKWTATFGFLSLLVFYWKEAGLMAESIAVPSIAVCTALAGWGLGKNAR